MTLSPGAWRAIALVVPALATLLLWGWRRSSAARPLGDAPSASPAPPAAEAGDTAAARDRRAAAGVLLAVLWNLPALLAVNVAADALGWWHFTAAGGLLLGVPVDVWVGWAVLHGAVPALGLPRAHLALVAGAALWIDVLAMPAATPILRLSDGWLVGEAVAIAVGLLPSQLLYRATRDGRRLALRATLQAIAFGGLVGAVLPAAVLTLAGDSPGAVLARARPHGWLWVQLLAVPAALGISAVQELAERGGGTPFPFDPPSRLVTSGLYAYIANPMQTALCVVLAIGAVALRSPWMAAMAAMAVVFHTGLAAWSEEQDLAARFGVPWRAYRRQVRRFLPRWRPFAPAAPVARLYLARGCGPCQELRRWIAARRPIGLELVDAQRHPTRDLDRVTYVPVAGGIEVDGVVALARALEHLHFGWAVVGALARLPGVSRLLQLIGDVSGAGPRRVERDPDLR